MKASKIFSLKHLLLTGTVGVGVFIAGCSDPKINAVDAATYKKSLQTMRESLSDSKRQKLDQALEKIFDCERKRAASLGSAMGDGGIMLLLDEMTADDIIQRAESIK